MIEAMSMVYSSKVFGVLKMTVNNKNGPGTTAEVINYAILIQIMDNEQF